MLSYPRTRSRSVPGAAVEKWLETTCSSCGARGTVESARGLAAASPGLTVTMDDVVTPGFRRRSEQGEIIISPLKIVSVDKKMSGTYSRTKRYANTSYGCTIAPACWEIKDYQGPWALYLINGSPAGGTSLSQQSALSQSDISAAESTAATQAWAKTSGHSADILQDIAEITQTFNLLKDPLDKGHRFLDMIRRVQRHPKSGGSAFGNAYDAYHYASGMWLKYRYGVRPLVSSINGILKELSNYERPVRNTSRGTFSLYASKSTPGTMTYNASKNAYSTTVEDSYEVSCGVVIDEIISMSQALGVDASGMLALPWELVPYSFVADWFLNVNSFLRAVVPFTSKRPIGSWTKTKRTQTVRFNITGSEAATPSAFQLLRGASETWQTTWITTTRLPGISGPSLVFKPFAYQDVLADARVIDSLTLLTQKLDRVFKH